MIVYHGSDHIIETPVYHGSKRTVLSETEYDYEEGGEFNFVENMPDEHYYGGYYFAAPTADGWDADEAGTDSGRMFVPQAGKTYYVKALPKDYLQANFLVDLSQFDIVIGYRADDSYFSFAQDFVSGVISLNKLSEAMRLGKLGEQIVLKSRESFSHIRFLGAEPAIAETYYEKKSMRDREARRAYRQTKRAADAINELYILDIMREGIKNGDPRLR